LSYPARWIRVSTGFCQSDSSRVSTCPTPAAILNSNSVGRTLVITHELGPCYNQQLHQGTTPANADFYGGEREQYVPGLRLRRIKPAASGAGLLGRPRHPRAGQFVERF